MTVYRHSMALLGPDYFRAAVGFGLTGGPATFVQTTPAMSWILGIAAALFALYALNTALRHAAVIVCDENGISVTGPIGKSVVWSELRDVRLRYFSTRRDGRGGWMQLIVKGSGANIRIESTLAGFAGIVARAVKAAEDGGLDLSLTTLGNIEVLGIKNGIFTSANGSPCRIF